MSVSEKNAPVFESSESPARKSLAERIAGLTPDQRALYERRRKELSKGGKDKPRIPRLPGSGPWPASTDQTALWFIQQLEPSTSAYNIGNGFRMKGTLDVALLERCLNDVARRHQILRTVFKTIDGQPWQAVTDVKLTVPVVDVSGRPDPEAAAREEVSRIIREPFDLEKGPLVRLPLVRIAPGDHVFVGLLHHIVTDWWSYYVFYTELFGLYHAYSQGLPSPFSELPIQYADWAAWRDQWQKTDAFIEQENYWLSQVRDVPYVLEVPADRPRPPVQSHRGERMAFELPAEVTPRLRALNRRASASSFMTLLAALDVFLWRYSGEERFLVGTPVSADRDSPETSNLIGYMLNTLVLRADLSGVPHFLGLLGRVREVCIGALANKEYPFRHLVQRLNLEPDMSRMPLYQVEYLYISTENPLQNNPGVVEGKVALPGFEISSFGIDRKTSPVDLQITFGEAIDRIDILFEYNTDIFERSTIRRMGGHLVRLLDELSACPECPLRSISLLTEEEQRQMLEDLNPAIRPLPQRSLVRMFEAQVAATPESPAAGYDGKELSYGALNDAVNQFAHYLVAAGVRPGSFVGICLDRSMEMLVSMLAVLKAGGAYLPLDPEFPEARLRYMLQESAPAAVITTQALRSRLPQDRSALVLDSEEVMRGLERQSTSNPDFLFSFDQPAYVIYTSGSTGAPKGVVIAHRALAAFLAAAFEFVRFDSGHSHLAVTTIGFDISILELLLPLCHGARVIIASREDVRDALRLSRLVRSSRATSMQATPSHWNMLLAADQGCLRGVRILSGGEALPREVAQSLLQASGAEVFNLYGPTEATVWASCHQISEAGLSPQSPPVVTIGRPFTHYRMYVLDTCLEPRPVDVAGDLYIGGSALALGYLHRAALTSERFVADPFALPGARMYRTGDRARWRADGGLEFLGRADQQIKLRGFRIELGEIEAAIKAQPGVAQAAVVVTGDGHSEKQLVAYVVPEDHAALDTALVRRNLSAHLPEYMVPSTLMLLEALPLTPNGKLDRRALPAPEKKSRGYRAPRTPDEEVLCALFAGILGMERVGIDDNFFALGGHSLMATRLISQLRETLGIEVALRALFEAPTVADLAPHLHRAGKVREALGPQMRVDRLPLSHGQKRLWFIDRLEGASAQYNLPEALRLRGPLDLEALRHTVNTIVERHEILRTHFVEEGGEPFQSIVPSLALDIPLIDLSGWSEAGQRDHVAEAMQREWDEPFDLSRTPLLRLKLLRLAADDHVLLRTVHHIVSDGWSQGIFNREFMMIYQAACEGKKHPLPPLPLQYADFTLWQRKWIREETLGRDLEYWKKQLEGIPAQLELPKDRPRQPRRAFAAEVCPIVIPAAQVAALQRLGHSAQSTLYMTLLSAFAVLMHRYSGQDDIVVGSPIANRQQAALEDLIGFFVNSLIMRARIHPGRGFLDLLAAVRAAALEAYQHQDLPFERLVEELSPERRLNAAPIFQVVFALQNAPMGAPRLQGLEVEPIGASELRVRIDLEVHAVERDGGMELYWLYSRDLFDRWRIEQMARHYLGLLEAVAAAPSQIIASLEFLSAEDRHQILHVWNPPEDAIERLTLARLFEVQAEVYPRETALIFEDQSLSYEALNDRANRLARLLLDRGIGPEDVVALAVPRSLEMIVALLGILKAGAAWLPLDPAYPQDRLLFMLKDSGARCQLTTTALASRLPAGPPQILLDDSGSSLDAQSDINLKDAERLRCARPEHPAYVIYTSGSTGVPKGVVVTHAGLPSLIATRATRLGLTRGSRVLQYASLSFDVSVVEIFQTLATGATLVLIRDDQRTGMPLRDALVAHGITHATLPPAVLPTLEEFDNLPLPNLIVGGEACSAELAARWSAGRKMFNGYGPTETTVVATMAGPLSAPGAPPIGTPVRNTHAYVLDGSLGLTPAGVPGELYIAGLSLARGYLNRPALTAERFVASPWGPPGSRMYRTGDLARWRADGNLEFLGRTDHQIKVRGFRVELREIESALLRHPRVRESMVMLREPQDGEKHLVGYVIAILPEEDSAGAQAAHVEHWRQFYDSFRREFSKENGGARFHGWNSSYTGEPMPAEEMESWVETTVERLRALPSRQVLEVGCGTGLLLARLAGGCESYTGIDFSVEALNRIDRDLAWRDGLRHVQLRQGTADDLSFAGPGSVDLVIINSVTQYFPDIGYLLKVMAEAVRVTRPGGHIFIGDVRSLPLLEAYYASVQLFRSRADVPLLELSRRVFEAVSAEEELAVDPAFFDEIAKRWPEIGRVEVALKAGIYHNEMSRFRYDVTLTLGPKERPATPDRWLVWNQDGRWRDDLQQMLLLNPSHSIGVRGVPDLRVAPAVKAVQMLRSAPLPVSGVAEIAAACAGVSGEDPDTLISLARRLGVALAWSGFNSEGIYDVVFRPDWAPVKNEPQLSDSDLRRYGNSPARPESDAKLSGALQEHLRRSLPDYMVPSAVLVLPSWPLTPSGKIDRAALPVPERRAGDHRAPRTPQEEILCSIFAEVLSLPQVGVDDDFFSLGGHSLLATRLVSQIRATMGVDMPLRAIFEAPTVAMLAPLLLQGGQGRPPLAPQPRGGPLPLSYAQQRLWFIDQLEGGVSPEYNMPSAWRLRGDLDHDALRRAIETVIERHESLRTHFAQPGGEPVQIIQPPLPFDLPTEDISGLAESEQRELAFAAMRREWEQPFDLSRGPVLRLKLIRLGPQDHLLLRTFHHIVSDGWSVGIFSRELMLLYEAFREGRPNPLPPLKVQYADFALWQRQWLDRETLGRDLAYWKQHLEGIPDQLLLPKDRPRPLMQTYDADVCEARLPAAQSSAIRRLTRDSHATLYMSLLSLFSLLLQRYSGQEDIVVGSPIANRQESQLEDMIGFFVNSLVMRVRVKPEASYSELLSSVRSVALEAYQHQDVPFEKLVEELAPQRSLNRSPIFQVVFALQNAPMGRQQLKGLEVEPVGGEGLQVRFDLELHVFEHGDEMGFYWLYNKGLFDRWRMEQMARHLLGLLESALAEPAAPLRSLTMLSPAERRMLLVQFNATEEPLAGTTLLALFENQVRRAPDLPAVLSEGLTVSFSDLNERANRLAHHLMALGAGPEDLIAVALRRSPELIVALLGILKSGAAYLPVDLEVPGNRLQQMLSDAAPMLTIGDRELQGRIPQDRPVLVIDEPGFQRALQQASAANPEDAGRRSPLLPQHPAYVIYTSGSTGTPKGVVVSHQGLLNYLCWSIREYRAHQGAGSPVHSSVAFDLTVTSIFPALLTGKPVILAAPQQAAETLGDVLRDHSSLSLVKLTPAHLEALNHSLTDTVGRSHALVIGGEALKYESLTAWRAASPATRLINEYGPTEAVVGCCVYEVQTEDPASGDVPIGHPIANTRLYVLDQHFQPVPVGVPGELYIAGAGVARGYLKRPALTAERFVADPYGEPGSRMYRTGDLAGRRPDGALYFLGRTDQQLKIRGHRIEPEEVEAMLRRHERVSDALVTVSEQAGDRRLIGYAIAREVEAGRVEAQSSRVAHWQQLYDSTYSEVHDSGDFNLAGWLSSYTGSPIPPEEMRIWVEETVARIQRLHPRRVLEIGCGTGLLLTRIAGGCESYTGLDFSAQALDGLARHLAGRADLRHVTLRRGSARELQSFADDSVDLVIVNSVAQYFPDLDYFLQVLAEAERVTCPGGHIFIGDVRSLPLLEAQHASIELHRAAPDAPAAGLKQRMNLACQNEEELLLDARLFAELARRMKKTGRAQVELKAGAYDNELSRFRYDVTLTLGDRMKTAAPAQWLAWDEEGLWRAELEQALTRSPGISVGLQGMRDARAAAAVEAARLLKADGLANTEALSAACARIGGQDPNEVMQMAKRLGVELCWQKFGSDGVYDAIFNPVWVPEAGAGEAPRGYYRRYANSPVQTAGAAALGLELLDHLRQNLPAYMLPEAVMVVAAWPLTRNGKVDRDALPLPLRQRRESYRSPRTPQEDLLCRMFAEVLGLKQVGIDDNFFALGGHSLMATRLVSQMRSALGVELRIRMLFEAPTVAELVERLDVNTAPESAFDQLLPLRQRGALPPLFCAHPAGGLSWCYSGFMRELDAERPIYGLQAAEVMNDEEFPGSIEAMAHKYAQAMRGIQPAGPYYVLGWSFGGVLAHAIACALQQMGERVALLVIMDCFPFREGHEPPVESEEEALRVFAGALGIDLSELEGKRVDFASVYDVANRAGHVPADFDEKIARRTLQMMLHNASLQRTFRSGIFAGDLLFFYADKKEGEHSLPEIWKPHITGNLEVHTIHCRHFEMTDRGPIAEIGRILNHRLNQAGKNITTESRRHGEIREIG